MTNSSTAASLTGIRFDDRAVHLFWSAAGINGESILYRRSDGTLRFDPVTRTGTQRFQKWLLREYASKCYAFLRSAEPRREQDVSQGEWARVEWELKKESMYRRKLKQLDQEKNRKNKNQNTQIRVWRMS